MSPSVHQPLTSVVVKASNTAVLTCRICGRPRPNISWRFNDSINLVNNQRINIVYGEDGFASLKIHNATPADSGEYSCVATSELGSVMTKATLSVVDRPQPPTRPVIRSQVGTSVHLEWSPPHGNKQIQGYTIEFRENGSESWQAAIPYVPNTSQFIGDLTPGTTYQFRVSSNNSISMSEPSQPSQPVTIPSDNELNERIENSTSRWKSTFEKDFTEVEEIARGRFSVVKKVLQNCTNRELAVKCIHKRLIDVDHVEAEYSTLQSLQHENLIPVFDIYTTQSAYIIVMPLVPLGRLFEVVCRRQFFDEYEAANYIVQLLTVTQYLHNCRIAHLDIKPENLLVEMAMGESRLKLCDFGDAKHIYNNYYVHPFRECPEFLAPEIIKGTPIGLSTDIWSIGVVTYALLSGLSPFLDDSQEETCSNIIQGDYSFPDEYFGIISDEARDAIRAMLQPDLQSRPCASKCRESKWFKTYCCSTASQPRQKSIPTARLKDFVERKRLQSLELFS